MTACGLCSIDKDVHGTIDYHGIVHIWTEPYEEPESVRQDYDFWADYMPVFFWLLVIAFFLIVGAEITL